MKISPDSTCTHTARAMDPKDFRAQCTGIGHTARASRMSGGFRAQRVVDGTDAGDNFDCVPDAEGYPARSVMETTYGVSIGSPALQPGAADRDEQRFAGRLK